MSGSKDTSQPRGSKADAVHGSVLQTTQILQVQESMIARSSARAACKAEFAGMKTFLDDVKNASDHGKGNDAVKEALLKLTQAVIIMKEMSFINKAHFMCRVLDFLDQFETRTNRYWPEDISKTWDVVQTKTGPKSEMDRRDFRKGVADVEKALEVMKRQKWANFSALRASCGLSLF